MGENMKLYVNCKWYSNVIRSLTGISLSRKGACSPFLSLLPTHSIPQLPEHKGLDRIPNACVLGQRTETNLIFQYLAR